MGINHCIRKLQQLTPKFLLSSIIFPVHTQMQSGVHQIQDWPADVELGENEDFVDARTRFLDRRFHELDDIGASAHPL